MRHPPKQECFFFFIFSVLFIYLFLLVLHFVRISVITGSMRGYLDPTGSPTSPGCHMSVCHCQKVCCVSPSTVPRPWRFQETGCYQESLTGPEKVLNSSAGSVFAPLCKEEQSEFCYSPTKSPPAGHWCKCLTKQSEADFMRVARESDILYYLCMYVYFLYLYMNCTRSMGP